MRIHCLLPINMAWTAKPKPRRRKHREWVRRKFTQEQIRALRAEYAAMPRGPGGRVAKGAFTTLCAHWPMNVSYIKAILQGGLRDEERESQAVAQ